MEYDDANETAPETARSLEAIAAHGNPEDTGVLSTLDQSTMRWAERYPALEDSQRAFAAARSRQWPRSRTTETWQAVQQTARELAAGLRALGDVELVLCPERTEWGTCNTPLPETGQCPGVHHI